jgi:hypothetical protein
VYFKETGDEFVGGGEPETGEFDRDDLSLCVIAEDPLNWVK